MGDGTGIAQVRPAGFAGDLARHGAAPALHTADGVLTHAELAARVEDARTALTLTAPVGARHLVHLRPEPTADFVVAWLAALTGGHVTFLSPNAALAGAYGASATLTDGRWRPTGRPAPALHPDLRLLLSTSGSTGSPKLVRLSATNLDANAAAIADYLGLRPDDVALTTLPLDYCYGLSVLHSHLAAGASLVLDDRSVTDAGLWERARAHGVTSFAGVPHTFELLAASGWPLLPSLRQVTQAGGRMAPDRVTALARQGAREGWDLVVMYGQTEATARMAYLPPELAATRPGTVGMPIPGGRFTIDTAAEAAGGTDLADGVGELVYSGPNVMMGYATSPDDLARGAELTELRTGDLARFTDDGLVEIVGRAARFAKLFGQRIDLDRVQLLLGLGGHEVACAEATDAAQLVVAVPGNPDALVLEEVAAAACADSGLPPHAVRVVPVEALPRLANGKLDHRAVAALEAVEAVDDHPPVDALVRLYARVLGRPDAGPDDTFVGLGGDSLSYVELALRLERRLGRLPDAWPTMDVAALAALAPVPDAGGRRPRRSAWARIETGIALRAAAIVLIVGSHTDLWVLLGGAHVLLAVAGANFARFHLADAPPGERLGRLVRAAARIAVPAVLWIGGVTLLTGQYPWRSVVLLNDLTGAPGWSEPAWHYWFIEVVLLLTVVAGVVLAVPAVRALERRHRFAVPAAATALGLVPWCWAGASGYDGDVLHSSAFLVWLFAGGWAAAAATTVPQRVVVSALLLAGVAGFGDDPARAGMIAAGVIALVWLRTVPWPRLLVGPAGLLASASLYVYLTHWQVYPAFEDRWPLAGLVLSLVVGVATWRLVGVVPARLSAWTARRTPDRPHYAPDHDLRQEAR